MNRCSYDGCTNTSKWMVNARYREAMRLVCGVHLSREISVANTFNDERYPRRVKDNGVTVIPVA